MQNKVERHHENLISFALCMRGNRTSHKTIYMAIYGYIFPKMGIANECYFFTGCPKMGIANPNSLLHYPQNGDNKSLYYPQNGVAKMNYEAEQNCICDDEFRCHKIMELSHGCEYLCLGGWFMSEKQNESKSKAKCKQKTKCFFRKHKFWRIKFEHNYKPRKGHTRQVH